ncbi:STAS domain-containing protein [Vibrio sp. CAIM 722]|uniref:STAS domain-containing protein n=1 Tax=Vibrio eleionomae TaxID=2653505 RepID=A0A7X4LI82_9VIBR|nr:lipid asymmetry maintenance protein MlaB [Vibrio eleionomae]MZI92404.1 STAS domain-containing protein [Vibrio eleionomae]
MSHPQWQIANAQQVLLSGDLDRDTVPELWRELSGWTPSSKQLDVSLESVSRIDSAGMVMLIHLIEHAKQKNCHIMLSSVPEQLRTLFQLSNIEPMMAQHIENSAGVNCG